PHEIAGDSAIQIRVLCQVNGPLGRGCWIGMSGLIDGSFGSSWTCLSSQNQARELVTGLKRTRKPVLVAVSCALYMRFSSAIRACGSFPTKNFALRSPINDLCHFLDPQVTPVCPLQHEFLQSLTTLVQENSHLNSSSFWGPGHWHWTKLGI